MREVAESQLNSPPQVFLSYASEDFEKVLWLHSELVRRGVNVWLDKKNLGPGRWKTQIRRAITRSRFFVICLSEAALRKTGDEPGFQDEELNTAFNIAVDQDERLFTIIPVRLEKCSRGDHRLSIFQQYDLYDNWERGVNQLAVNLGGRSLVEEVRRQEQTEEEKWLERLLGKATAFYFAREYEKALSTLDEAIAKKPNYAEAWNLRGFALRGAMRGGEAHDAFKKALSIDRPYSPLLKLLGDDPDFQKARTFLFEKSFLGVPITTDCSRCGSSAMYCG